MGEVNVRRRGKCVRGGCLRVPMHGDGIRNTISTARRTPCAEGQSLESVSAWTWWRRTPSPEGPRSTRDHVARAPNSAETQLQPPHPPPFNIPRSHHPTARWWAPAALHVQTPPSLPTVAAHLPLLQNAAAAPATTPRKRTRGRPLSLRKTRRMSTCWMRVRARLQLRSRNQVRRLLTTTETAYCQ